jgi:hypothetical protein
MTPAADPLDQLPHLRSSLAVRCGAIAARGAEQLWVAKY